MRAGRGSGSGSSVLAEAIRCGTAPSAIVMTSRDAIVMTGALVAAELYGRHCAIMLLEEADWVIGAGWRMAVVEAGEGLATIHGKNVK